MDDDEYVESKTKSFIVYLIFGIIAGFILALLFHFLSYYIYGC